MFLWPELDLTDAERKYVGYYATPEKPGVLRRTYKIVLANRAIPLAGILQPALIQNLQISRRARVFGLTFAGDVSCWWLEIKTASGEQYTPPNTLAAQLGNPPGCLVSSMLPGTPWNVAAVVGAYPGVGFEGQQYQAGPLILEPNGVLVPNETLIFSGTPQLPPLAVPPVTVALEIGIHVWEFPNMAGR